MCLETREHCRITAVQAHAQGKINEDGMADVIYKVQCKDCPCLYIVETTRPLEVRLKEHRAKADKITKARTFTRQQRKSSLAEDFKSMIAEHATTENHTLDWDNAKKLEQVLIG